MKRFLVLPLFCLALVACRDATEPDQEMLSQPPQLAAIANAVSTTNIPLIELPNLGGLFPKAIATDINSSGAVSGSVSGGGGVVWERGEIAAVIGLASALAINSRGQVAGRFTVGGASHVYFWDRGVATDIGTLGGSTTSFGALNNWGQIVGQSTTGTGEFHAYLWENGVMTDLGALPGHTWSEAVAINELGSIVGVSRQVAGDNPHAVVWEPWCRC